MKKLLASILSVAAVFVFAVTAFAATTVVVTPTDTQGWSEADTRPGGDVNYVTDPTSPYPDGALQLTTNSTNDAKAQYLHEADLPLSDVTELSYYNKQNAGPIHAAASYQLLVDLNGDATGGFTTFVYEPYQNGVVTPNAWQQWDVDAGQMWSSRTFTDGTCAVVAGAGGAPFYTLAGLQAACPDAEVLGFGVNVGTFNPGYDVYVDGVTFNGTIYDFELTNNPTAQDECKDGGWEAFGFRNQGQCIRFVNTGQDSR